MVKGAIVLMGAILISTAGAAQDDSKEQAARKALADFRAAFSKAKDALEMNRAIRDNLEKAEPHPVIRAELIRILAIHGLADVRLEAASSLGKYKHDADACKALLATARAEKNEQIQLRCLGTFGRVAHPRMAADLLPWINHKTVGLAQAGIQAAETVNSVRMIRPLTELLGELEAISADAEGAKASGEQMAKYLRRDKLLPPTLMAIQALWKKCDPNLVSSSYKEALGNLQKHGAQLQKIQQEEDKLGRGGASEGKKEGDKKP